MFPVRALALATSALLGVTPAVAAPTPSPTPTSSPSVAPTPVPTPTKTPKPKPKKTIERVKVAITPDKGSFGVGQLITARFSAPVAYKANAERAMVVTGSNPLPPGAWGWIDSTTAVYRPKDFWPGHTRIDVNLSLHKVRLNGDASTRWIGGVNSTRTVKLRTTRSMVSKINANTHQMRVYRDGVLIKVFGVSLGKPGFVTRSGIKIITGEKYRWQRMTSGDLGLTDETYDLQVPYAVRITPSGEFIHGAPWASARIGVYNGSHGCTNLKVPPARWFFERVKAGDPTVTTGTGRPMETWNGTPGAYWNYSWADWKAKSALS